MIELIKIIEVFMVNRRPRRKRNNNHQNSYKPPFDEQILSQPSSSLSFRNENTLQLLEGAGIKTLRDILIREEKDFYRIFTFKKRNLLDVIGALRAQKLYLKPTEKQEPQTQPTDEQKQQQQQNKKPSSPKERPERRNENDRRNNNRKENDAKNPKQRNERRNNAPKLPQDIYIKINKGGKWGFADRSNKIVIEPQYDEVFNFKEELCCVEKDEQFGFIDRQGQEIIPIIYDCALSFSQGLACVYKNGKCGYIDKNNDIIIDFKFDAGTPFENDECRIKRDGKWGELKLEDKTNIRWIN